MKKNKHQGRKFDDFLKEEEIYDEANARALKKTSMMKFIKFVSEHRGMKAKMRKALNSPSAVERVLGDDPHVQYDTLVKAGASVGLAPVINWVPISKVKLE